MCRCVNVRCKNVTKRDRTPVSSLTRMAPSSSHDIRISPDIRFFICYIVTNSEKFSGTEESFTSPSHNLRRQRVLSIIDNGNEFEKIH